MPKVIKIQEEILAFLGFNPSSLCRVRVLHRGLHPERYGVTLWNEAYQGLIKSGVISETGRGTKSSPRMVSLVIPEMTDILKAVNDQMPVIENLLSAHLAVIREQYLRTI